MTMLLRILRQGLSITSQNPIAAAYSILSSEEISVITWERLYEVANEDRLMVKLKEVVLRGFPQSS